MRLSKLSAVLLITLSGLSPLALAAEGRPPAPAVTRACSLLDTSGPQRERCAAALSTALSEEPRAPGILRAASKSGQLGQTRKLLRDVGLGETDANAATIVIRDDTGGAGRIKDISVEISCCPLKITIIIRL